MENIRTSLIFAFQTFGAMVAAFFVGAAMTFATASIAGTWPVWYAERSIYLVAFLVAAVMLATIKNKQEEKC